MNALATTLSDLQVRLGTLSKPSKMPGYAWGIPAKYCITGAKLREQANSPCSKCYAMKGRYLWPNVVNAYEKRYQAWLHEPDWVPLMAELIDRRTKSDDPHFRWFDSGDLQSEKMLGDIVQIAWKLPHINFWLPTQERGMVTGYTMRERHGRQSPRAGGEIPTNLTIRISHPTIGGFRPLGWTNTSGVLPKAYKEKWPARVKRLTNSRHYCPAPTTSGSCGPCRACWDPEVSTVIYLEH